MMRFKPSMLTLALMTAGVSLYSHGAEPADKNTKANKAEQPIEVMEVTGIRRSLQESQATKMANSSVVEAVSSEDIGKLPDVSIAESLARLPGVAAQRLDGRANVISIRGLGPDFTTATLNGREQASVNDNRGVEFDQYPSELLDQVVVYKTPDASLMSQSIGGTVDMQTISPLAHGEQTIVVGARGEYNDLGELNSDSTDKGYRFNLSYVDQFLDDTLGVAVGYARMQSPNQEERWQAWGYPELNDKVADSPKVLGGAKPYVRSSELERDGVLGVIEYQPNEQFRSVVDLYYTKFQDQQLLRGIEIPGQWGGGWANSGITANKVENGLVTEGTINKAAVVVRNDVNTRDADSVSVGWNNQYQINNDWAIEADIGLSRAKRTDIGLETYSGTGRGNNNGATDTLGFKFDGDGRYLFSHDLNYADPNLIKLGGPFSWGNPIGPDSQDGFINKPEIKDEIKSMQLAADYMVSSGIVSNVEFGVNYSDREKSKLDQGFFLTLKGYPNMLTVPSKYLQAPTSLDFFGMGDMLSYDALAFYNDGNYIETNAKDVELGRATNSWKVYEKVTTGFVKVDLESSIADLPLAGNVGLQAVHTDQSSDGTAASTVNGKVITSPVNAGDTYLEWLPSMNLSLEVAEGQVVRLAAARTLTRARMDKMNASFSYNYNANPTDGVNWSGGGGNPELRPWLARQYDLSYENYFADQGYFALAGFYKDLENYVFDEKSDFNFGALFPDKTGNPIGTISKPENGNGGYVRGLEASGQLDFGYFTPVLEGFGVYMSATYNESEVKETASSKPTTLPGLSEKTFNATVYYETNGFEARVSSRYRSDFLGEVTKISLQRELVNVMAETVVDAQVGYDFSESGIDALYGLTVLFQVNNLTNEPFISYFGDDKRFVRDYQNYGRNFMLGANYKF